MKNNYKNFIDYLQFNDGENTLFTSEIKALENDIYSESLILLIVDSFNDEVMLKDFSMSLMKEMFVYYTKHHK